LLATAKGLEVPHVYIHFFGDGRDTDPRSSARYLQELLDKIKELGMEKTAKIGTIVGRYYAMDRDKRYSLVVLAT
jgi:2,3-bisphosphoglycerate-independent phosphoglycerate mutase